MEMSYSMLLTVFKYTLGAAATGSILIAGGLWYFQRHLIYPSNLPSGSRKDVPKPSQLGMPYEDIYLTTRDKLRLHAYLIPARRHFTTTQEAQQLGPAERKARFEKDVESWVEEIGKEDAVEYVRSRPTVIIFHANAGNMGHRIPLARKFNVDHGCNVFMLSYRGYGLSQGHASELGIRIDVEAALEYIKNHPLVGNTKFILYGQSIGGAVSLYAAANHPDMISGIILENTFTSITALVPHIMPQIPRFLLPILLAERWDAALTLPKIPASIPMLMLSGLRDELVPPSHMRTLLAVRQRGVDFDQVSLSGSTQQEMEKEVSGGVGKGGRVRWREYPLGGHNDTCLIPDYWKAVGEWLREEIEVNDKSDLSIQDEKQANIGEGNASSEGSQPVAPGPIPVMTETAEGDDSSETGSWTEVETSETKSQQASPKPPPIPPLL